MESLSSVAMKPQLRLLKVSKVHGSLPRVTKMSTSLVAKVQSTVMPTEPVAVVMNTTGATVFGPMGPLPCEMTLVTCAGGGGGVGLATQPGPVGLLLQGLSVPQLGSTSAEGAMSTHARTARPPPYCFRAFILIPPSEVDARCAWHQFQFLCGTSGCRWRAHRAAAVPRGRDRSVSIGTRCEVWESRTRGAVRRRGGARDQVLSECAEGPAAARCGLVGEAVHAGPGFLVDRG